MRANIEIDSNTFRKKFDRAPFRVRHCLDDHPSFRLPRLAALAKELPADQVEYNAGDVPVGLDPVATPLNGLSAEETVRRIEHCRSWMVLKNVETNPDFAVLLDDCLERIVEQGGQRVRGLHLPEAFVFVSSPGSVTPFHIDPEHNFLFQVRGRKTIFVFDPADRELVGERDLESFYAGAHRNLAFRDEWQARAREFELLPGDGLHVPVAAPHWVRNEEAVSISFSVTFRSRASKRAADAWQMNHRLRRLGLEPAPAGRSGAADLLKQGANRLIRRAGRIIQPFARRAGT